MTALPPEVEAAYRLIDTHAEIARIDNCIDYHRISIENLQADRDRAVVRYAEAQSAMAKFDIVAGTPSP